MLDLRGGVRICRAITIQHGTEGMLDVQLEERLYMTEDDPHAARPLRILLMAYMNRLRVMRAAFDGTNSASWAYLREDLTHASEGGRPLTVVRH